MKTSILSAINHAIISRHRSATDIATRTGTQAATYGMGMVHSQRAQVSVCGCDYRAAQHGFIDQNKINLQVDLAYQWVIDNFKMEIERTMTNYTLRPVYFNVVQTPAYNPMVDVYVYALVIDFIEFPK